MKMNSIPVVLLKPEIKNKYIYIFLNIVIFYFVFLVLYPDSYPSNYPTSPQKLRLANVGPHRLRVTELKKLDLKF